MNKLCTVNLISSLFSIQIIINFQCQSPHLPQPIWHQYGTGNHISVPELNDTFSIQPEGFLKEAIESYNV